MLGQGGGWLVLGGVLLWEGDLEVGLDTHSFASVLDEADAVL